MKKIFLSILAALALSTPVFSSQHDYVIADNPGAVVRADINSALGAIATLNSGATEPATTYANMWWFDTANNLLKKRNNANNAWDTVALINGSGVTPYFQGSAITSMATEAYASQAQAETGTDNDTVMTPLRTAQRITSILASQAEAEAGSNNTKIMTPLRVAQAIAELTISEDTQVEVFTTSGTWVAPTAVNYIKVTMCGGGGGGASPVSAAAGGGGSGACVINHIYKVTPTSSYTVTIGAAGAAGNSSGNGGNGGTTSLAGGGYTLTTLGGDGGSNSGPGGTGAVGSTTLTGSNSSGSTGGAAGAAYVYAGANGGTGSSAGGGGAASMLSRGGAGGNNGSPGNAAAGPGAGGGGGGSAAGLGGAGGTGIMIISYNENGAP